jgi:hypothetical protein
MIIHSTFTNGYFEFSKLFLNSFKQSNGNELKVVFTTSDLTDDQMKELKSIYNNLIIHNKKFDYKPICKALRITKKRAKQLKYEVEHENARKESMRPKWKMHVAAENRVKIDIPFIMKEYESEDLIAHFDIDMYFKKPLDKLFKIMRDHDFTVMYRPHLKKEWRRIWMCAMGIKTNNINSTKFIEGWGKELDKIPLKDKPFAYGQTSCYRVYKRFLTNSSIKFGNVPESFILAGTTGRENCLIVSGNKSTVGKDRSLQRFKLDFEKRTLK